MYHSADRARTTPTLIAIPGVWFVLFLFLALSSLLSLQAQSLEALSEAYRKRPSENAKQQLLAFANSHRDDANGALALLVVGTGELSAGEAQEAIAHLRAAQPNLPQIGDYVSYYLAQALFEIGDYRNSIAELEKAISNSPPSPLAAKAVLLAARVYLDSGDAPEAVRLMREYLPVLPQADGLLLLGQSQEASGSEAAAAATYQRVYYEYPTSGASSEAASALGRLRSSLGSSYPPVSSQAMFTRIEALIRAGEHLTARKELQGMTTSLGGLDRDRARVWLGKARHARGHDDVAYKWLVSLRVEHPHADAERLYYLVESARGLGRRSDVMIAINTLTEKYPDSEWRMEALSSAGNMYLLTNDRDDYLPLYRACAESFPTQDRAAYCDWKVVWTSYLGREPGAGDQLRAHLQVFPASDKASAALYFLGRLSERSGDMAAAGTFYREVEHEYPNYYYAYLARERLTAIGPAGNGESAEVTQFLKAIEFPTRRHQKNFEPTPETTARLERANMLISGGLRDWGEAELRFGARNGAQGPILAVGLSESAALTGDYGRSLRYIKALAPGYLSMALEDAPLSFWKLAFPMPYRATLEEYSQQRDLDVYLLAALIRQESEFDTNAVSRARAYGLTQVLPATGREINRSLKINGFRTAMLRDPKINVNMGTYYLRKLIDSLDGHTEAALAAYNAGKSRSTLWLTWADYQEPAEFVETIPFTETRNYVQVVLRNADIYRRLYRNSAAIEEQP